MIKVAGYCRVSTDHEDQVNSFSSQKRYFREYIERHPDWELYEIYADEGISGTSTKKRFQFNRMISDGYNGKFQLILTKEVSRFSRNILDTIAYTRELKAHGIGVIFMSDGFSTMDPDAELRLSIMGSIAQEESRKTSTRVKWGQTRQMERGVVFGTSMLGYDVQNGTLSINPEGAEIVKLIFYKYGIEKKGTTTIARELREIGCKTYTGNPIWNESYILKILKNEKYVGDLVQKKTITPDYLTHEKKCNRGQEDFIVHTNHHEAIITRELWERVQDEISKRHRTKNSTDRHSNRYIFSGKIICGQCGSRFISRTKTRADGTSYRCWGCFKASKEGRKKTDAHGNTLGCDIGKQIRDELAIDILKYVLLNLEFNREEIANRVAKLALNVIEDEQRTLNNRKKIQQDIATIHDKKSRAVDAYLSGVITEYEFLQMREVYDRELQILQAQVLIAAESIPQGALSLREAVDQIITCQTALDTFYKALLDYMVIHKNGMVDVKLNRLPTIWKFQLFTEKA